MPGIERRFGGGEARTSMAVVDIFFIFKISLTRHPTKVISELSRVVNHQAVQDFLDKQVLKDYNMII